MTSVEHQVAVFLGHSKVMLDDGNTLLRHWLDEGQPSLVDVVYKNEDVYVCSHMGKLFIIIMDGTEVSDILNMELGVQVAVGGRQYVVVKRAGDGRLVAL